jgi:hypothetical protein
MQPVEDGSARLGEARRRAGGRAGRPGGPAAAAGRRGVSPADGGRAEGPAAEGPAAILAAVGANHDPSQGRSLTPWQPGSRPAVWAGRPAVPRRTGRRRPRRPGCGRWQRVARGAPGMCDSRPGVGRHGLCAAGRPHGPRASDHRMPVQAIMRHSESQAGNLNDPGSPAAAPGGTWMSQGRPTVAPSLAGALAAGRATTGIMIMMASRRTSSLPACGCQ